MERMQGRSRERGTGRRTLPGRGLACAAAVLFAGLTVLAAAPAAAQTTVDDFSTNQSTITDPPGGATSVATGGADILGQHRDLTVDLGTGAGPASVGVAGGVLNFTITDTTPDSEASATVTWDGDTDPNVLAPTGLGGVDLTTGGATALRIRAGAGGAAVSAIVEVYTDAGDVSRAGLVIPVGAAQDRFLAFSSFVVIAGSGADFTDVGAITLELSAREASATVDLIDAVTPQVAAAKNDTLQVDNDSDMRADPGDTLRYTITITNTGGAAKTVSLADTVDANTTLVGTARTTPITADDQYAALSAMVLDTAASGAPGLLDNDADPDGDAVAAVVASGQATLRGGSVDVAADGDFVYTPPVGFFGVDSFTYTLQAVAGDPTTDANGSPIGAHGATAFVVIEPIPPVVTAGATLAYTENDPPTVIDNTVTVTDPDSPNLAGATVQITANYQNGADVLSFTNMLGITGVFAPATGTLTLTGAASPASYQTALRSVKYKNTSDDPTTGDRTVTWIADDGFATSVPVTSTIQVTAVNDPPVLTAGATLNYTENDPATAIDVTITASDPDNTNLQSATAQITANYVNGQDVLSFTNMLGISGVFTPATGTMTLSGSSLVANYQTALRSVKYVNTSENPSANPRTVTWIASDGSLPSSPVFSTINVIPVNDPPVAGADSWDTVGNTQLVVDLPALATPHVRDTTPSTFGVLDNDSDPAEGNALAVSAIVGCADATPPFGDSPTCATANGGSVVMQANGRFTYTPPVGTVTNDTFQYTVTDDGTPAPASSNGTVTIHFFERVWYVKNNSAAGGLGRSNDPFDTLVEAQTASSANDWIFVHFGGGTSTGQAAGIALKAGQHLVGEHHGLAIAQNLNGNGSPQTLFTAVPGNRPLIDNSGAGNSSVSATNVIPAEIVGLSLQSAAADAVNLTNAVALPANATTAIQDNVIRGAGAVGIDVKLNAGTTGTLGLTVTGNSWNAAGTHTGNAVDINRAAGTLNLNLSNNTGILSAATAVNVVGGAAANTVITGFANNTVHQATGASGIVVSNATFDAAPGTAGYQQVSGGTTAVGISGDGVGAVAMLLSSVAGDLAFTDLDLYGAAGFSLSGTGAVNVGAGTGTRVTVGTGVATFASTGGPAVDVNGATVDLQLAGLTVSASGGTGVSLVGVADGTTAATFSAPSGSSIAGASGTAFNLDGGNATVTYNGTITNSAGRSVAVQNRTADTATFTGAITDTGTGILLSSNNVASTTNFQGGLSLTTGANAAFTATSGGTLNVCDENPCNPGATGSLVNTLTTTTGTALNVASTTIGANNLEFRSISANGASSGIVLNNTGTSGGLKVTGTAAANSGGTIQNTTGAGISLTTTRDVSLNKMTLASTADSGVNGTGVTNFAFTNGTVTNAGNANPESAIAFDNGGGVGVGNNIAGALTITGNTFTNPFYSGLDVQSDNGVVTAANVSNNVISNPGFSGVNFVGDGNGSTSFTLDKATIDQNNISSSGGNGVQITGGNGSGSGPGGTFGIPGDATNVIAITNNSVELDATGTQAITVAITGANAASRGRSNFLIQCNGRNTGGCSSPTAAGLDSSSIGTVILIGCNGYTTMTGTVNNNVITAVHTVGGGGGNGIAGGNGVGGAGNAWTPDLTLVVTNNAITGTDGNGILLVSRGTSGTAKFKIQNNTVATPLSGIRQGIRVDAGNASSADDAVCLNISGNTTSGSADSGFTASGIGLRKQGTSSTVNDFSVNGMAATSSPGVESYVGGLNPGSTTGNFGATGVDLISATSGFSNCSFP
jgi:Bacterial Ig domain/Bacterial cadherin-like domain